MEKALYEYRCTECKEIMLLERARDPDTCPYCQGDIDYAQGKIEPVLFYKPRKNGVTQ